MTFYLMPTIVTKEINSSYVWVQRCPVLAVRLLHILCNQNVKQTYSLYQMSVCLWSTLYSVKQGEDEEYLNVSCNFWR